MKFGLKYGLLAAALLALSSPAFADNPAPAQSHDLSMSVEHNTPSMVAAANNTCGSGQTAAAMAGNMHGSDAGAAAHTAGSTDAAAGNIGKCHTPDDANGHSGPSTGASSH